MFKVTKAKHILKGVANAFRSTIQTYFDQNASASGVSFFEEVLREYLTIQRFQESGQIATGVAIPENLLYKRLFQKAI